MAGRKNTIQILSDLQKSYIHNKDIQCALGKENERIIRSACKALSLGDAECLGNLMNESQDIFDKNVSIHSKKELESPLLHKLLSFDHILPDIYGGKGVGSQGDGTVQFVAKNSDHRAIAMYKISSCFPSMKCFTGFI